MKKSLLALAVLGAFAGVASAQSSVTVYGVVDVGVAKGNGGTAINPAALGTSKAYQLITSKTSRLGFRGNEDLGGGLSAQFQIEHRFNPDTGTQNSAAQFWNGLSYVQLSSVQAGKVYLGRYYTPTFLMLNRVDPFGWDGVAQVGTNQYAGYLNPDTLDSTGAGVRTSNTVGYTSPTFFGVSGTVAISASEGTQRGRDTAAVLQYAAGPIYAGVGYERVYKGSGAVSMRGQGLIAAAVSYDFGVAKILGSYTRSKTSTPTVPSNVHTVTSNGVGVDKNDGAMIGALVPVGPASIKLAYSRVDPRRANNTRQKYSGGVEYNLSKRTLIYVDAAYAKEDQFTNNKVYAVGLRHFF